MAEKTAKWGIPRVCTDFDDAIDDMDGGIILMEGYISIHYQSLKLSFCRYSIFLCI